MKTIRFISVVCLLFALLSCGSNIYLNKTYKFNNKSDFKLAIIPFYGELPAPTDTAFTLIFADSVGAQKLISPSSIRSKIDSDNQLKDIIQKICMKGYTKEEQSKEINIKDLIAEDGLTYLREACGNADVCLFPIRFFVGASMGRLVGATQYRLYDLHSGILIYDVNESLNTELGHPDVDKQMVLTMIGLSYGDYEKHFLRK